MFMGQIFQCKLNARVQEYCLNSIILNYIYTLFCFSVESQFADSDQKTVGTITTRLSEQTLNSNSVVPDEKPPNKVEQENNKHLNSVLLKAVNVKEFIPTASFKPISNQSVIQDSIPADEAPPTNAFLVGDTGDEYAQSVLMNVVLTLTMYPGEFDNQIVWVADELRKHVKTEDSLKEVIRIILEQVCYPRFVSS